MLESRLIHCFAVSMINLNYWNLLLLLQLTQEQVQRYFFNESQLLLHVDVIIVIAIVLIAAAVLSSHELFGHVLGVVSYLSIQLNSAVAPIVITSLGGSSSSFLNQSLEDNLLKLEDHDNKIEARISSQGQITMT
eukprot:TRINITY_DN3567_c0_g1_i3.p3 TRINITY_DN3567_c0_g1~~TRINITY_DN3567_c0_g1_i3.p3  ORF type:complete len:135 (+),score=24.58 TRINITY_DN3567_c0_g1_i3:481-885(+)